MISGEPVELEGVDPLSARVFHAFMGITHRQRQLLHRVFSEYDLHPAQAMCLRVLLSREQLGQSELADALMLSRPSTTRILQRMERSGLVVRRADDADQRHTVVTLTPEGRELQHRLDAALATYVRATIATLPERDREELARILLEWSARMDREAACPMPDRETARTLSDPSG